MCGAPSATPDYGGSLPRRADGMRQSLDHALLVLGRSICV